MRVPPKFLLFRQAREVAERGATWAYALLNCADGGWCGGVSPDGRGCWLPAWLPGDLAPTLRLGTPGVTAARRAAPARKVFARVGPGSRSYPGSGSGSESGAVSACFG